MTSLTSELINVPFSRRTLTLFTVPHNLARTLKKILKKEKIKEGLDIEVVEKAGIKIGKLLPGLKGKENREGRLFYPESRGQGKLQQRKYIYKGTCLTSRDEGKKSVCIGATSRSDYHARGRQHIEAIMVHRRIM